MFVDLSFSSDALINRDFEVYVIIVFFPLFAKFVEECGVYI